MPKTCPTPRSANCLALEPSFHLQQALRAASRHGGFGQTLKYVGPARGSGLTADCRGNSGTDLSDRLRDGPRYELRLASVDCFSCTAFVPACKAGVCLPPGTGQLPKKGKLPPMPETYASVICAYSCSVYLEINTFPIMLVPGLKLGWGSSPTKKARGTQNTFCAAAKFPGLSAKPDALRQRTCGPQLSSSRFR